MILEQRRLLKNMIERSNLIAMLVGYSVANNKNIDGSDLKIVLDNHLIKCHQQPLGKEDTELLQQVLDELIISVLGQGLNRKDRRSA